MNHEIIYNLKKTDEEWKALKMQNKIYTKLIQSVSKFIYNTCLEKLL